jgi:hypothetical protein
LPGSRIAAGLGDVVLELTGFLCRVALVVDSPTRAARS